MTPPDTQPNPPVTPRPAATLMVLRDGPAGPEVLMGRRSAGHRFMPNSLVFPGGAVDAEDANAAVATPLPPHVQRLLAKDADAAMIHALGVAAARELTEECALTLGDPPALDGLDYLCRAITPAARPRRFDAHFFIVSATRVTGTHASSHELEDVRYVPIIEALAGELEFPTRGALQYLETWLTLTPAARQARTTLPVMRERTWYEE